jgi:soluble lytic murein transglycosylase-like protein
MAVALALATPVGAETRRVSDRTSCRTCIGKSAAHRPVTATAMIAPRPSRPVMPREDDAYAREIAEASARYAVPERLIWAVIRVESGFDRRAVSPKGAQGLMQLMPQTAAALGVKNAFDPEQNLDGGTRHLAALVQSYGGDLKRALAAYNAGAGAVQRHGGVPPFPETRDYVSKVMKRYRNGS